MTGRNVLDAMWRAFACSNIPQCDHFSSLKLKARYFVERASDGSLRNPFGARPGYKVEGLGDVNVRSAQTLTRESINHSVEPNVGQISKVLQGRPLS